MRKWIFIISLLALAACSTTRDPAWDSGAEKQEAVEQKMRQEEEFHFRNQFPGGRAF